MTNTRGVVYIAFGDKHRQQARGSIESLRRCRNTHPILVYTDCPREFVGHAAVIYAKAMRDFGSMWSRFYKTMIHRLSPWDFSLFLDADTLVLTKLEHLWRVLEAQPLAMASLYKPEHNSFGCFHLGMTGWDDLASRASTGVALSGCFGLAERNPFPSTKMAIADCKSAWMRW